MYIFIACIVLDCSHILVSHFVNLLDSLDARINCKIFLNSAGLHEFFGWFCVVLFEGKSPLKKCLNFDGLSRQETSP